MIRVVSLCTGIGGLDLALLMEIFEQPDFGEFSQPFDSLSQVADFVLDTDNFGVHYETVRGRE